MSLKKLLEEVLSEMLSEEKTDTPVEFKKHPYVIGEKYLIRTVTMIYTGKLIEVHADELVIKDAAWIADTGRWHDACTKGTLNEVEPYAKGDSVIVSRGAILDVSPWSFDLPSEQK